jgi:Cu-processing system permease protein
MMIISVARLELMVARRNMWVTTSVLLMALFTIVLTLAGGAPTGRLGVDPLVVATASITTLSVYLIPLIGLLLSFDAIVGEAERGTLALSLTYPLSRMQILLGKLLAHLAVLGFAVAVGLGLTAALTIWQAGADVSFTPLIRLFFTSLALGAAFLGIGYMVSAMVRQTGAAAGLVIIIWLVCVVLYDLALLGALVADANGGFTRNLFPYLLVANPADAFRLINMPVDTLVGLTSGIGAAAGVSGLAGQLTSLLLWPVLALFLASVAFYRIEP